MKIHPLLPSPLNLKILSCFLEVIIDAINHFIVYAGAKLHNVLFASYLRTFSHLFLLSMSNELQVGIYNLINSPQTYEPLQSQKIFYFLFYSGPLNIKENNLLYSVYLNVFFNKTKFLFDSQLPFVCFTAVLF